MTYPGLAVALVILAAATATPASAQETERSQAQDFRIVTVAEGLEHPWGLAFLPDGRFLVTERPGRLRVVEKDGSLSPPLGGVPEVVAISQGGLLDVALDPDFQNNRLVYLSYSERGEGGQSTAAARGRLEGSGLTDVEVIFRQEPKLSGGAHFGSRFVFAPDGTLLISLGERYRKEEAQDRSNHLGTIVRINPDGSVPKDNPFVNAEDAQPEIYTWGNRNVQGMALNPWTREVWFHEHGPQGGDEVNILEAGANYGWPKVTFGIGYSGEVISNRTKMEGVKPPLLHWTPSIAPSGLAFYDGDKFPGWKGDMFAGALALTHLRRVDLDENMKAVGQEELLGDLGERIRDVRAGPDGFIYLLTDSSEGRILRLEPAGG